MAVPTTLLIAVAGLIGGGAGVAMTLLWQAARRRAERRSVRAPVRSGRLGTLDPLRHPVFRWIWLASLASQFGGWFHNVGAVDLMTVVAPSALLLTLVQTATSLPGLLLALPSGALADIVDRRRLLLAASGWMCGVSALTAVTAYAHIASWWWLLALTFALGVGTIAALPAWQAIVPEVVPREGLAPAVTLQSLAINMSRTVAPAVGGLAIAVAGPAAAFALSTAVLAFTTLVLLGWRRQAPLAATPREGVGAAIRSGLGYGMRAAPIRTILARTAGFVLCGSALWALMPVRGHQFGLGLTGYSGMLCALGAGGVVCGLLLTHVRRRVGPDAIVLAGSAVFMAASMGVGVVRSYPVVLVLMFGAGVAWVGGMSSFNVAVQQAAPEWVRGRVLAAWSLTHLGSLAVGSALWGLVTGWLGVVAALDLAGILMAATVILALPCALDAVVDAPAGGDRPPPQPSPRWGREPVPPVHRMPVMATAVSGTLAEHRVLARIGGHPERPPPPAAAVS